MDLEGLEEGELGATRSVTSRDRVQRTATNCNGSGQKKAFVGVQFAVFSGLERVGGLRGRGMVAALGMRCLT